METLLKAIKHRWRSCGFGIHSPFAYHFVTEVLCLSPAYTYYAYALTSDRHMRLLVRLLAFFNPASVCIRLGNPREAAGIVRAVVPSAAVLSDSAEFTITDMPLAVPGNALVLGREAVAALAALPMEHGMIFSNGRDCAVVAALPHLPRQDFEIHL